MLKLTFGILRYSFENRSASVSAQLSYVRPASHVLHTIHFERRNFIKIVAENLLE